MDIGGNPEGTARMNQVQQRLTAPPGNWIHLVLSKD